MTDHAAGAAQPGNGKRSLLHVGAGIAEKPVYFSGYEETRLDLDAQWEPDIVANMADLSCIPDGSYDAVYCSHALEHLYVDEVRAALSEFRRVLKENGLLIVIVPDLEGVQPDDKVLYTSPAGDITGRDLHYGYAPLARNNPMMVHRCGFVAEYLNNKITEAGFTAVVTDRLQNYNLIGAASK